MKKNQKPIEVDAHFKYICENCGINHWVSLKEASTKNFIVVCDCNNSFVVKRIKKVKILYNRSVKSSNQTAQESVPEKKPKIEKTIDQELLNKSICLLETFGFTKTEAQKLLVESYKNNPIDDCIALVKYSLSTLGEQNV